MVQQKQCRRCRISQPRSAFTKNNAKRDGLSINCRACEDRSRKEAAERVRSLPVERRAALAARIRGYKRAYYEKNRDALRSKKPGKRKQTVKFKAKLKRYYERNAERLKQNARNRHKQNPLRAVISANRRRARAKNAGGRHTDAQIASMLLKQSKRCAMCSVSIQSGFHIDHVMPLARGGSDDISNIQLLCPPCNRQKGAKDPIEARREHGQLL